MVKIKKELTATLKKYTATTTAVQNKFIKRIRVVAEIDKDDQKNTMLEMD
jgi:hypothetical protein